MSISEMLSQPGVGYAILIAVTVFAFATWGAVEWHRSIDNTPPDGKQYPWVPLEYVMSIVRSPHWSWTRNHRCKYISLRMDTRTSANHCVIYDRHGEPITLDELRWQDPASLKGR